MARAGKRQLVSLSCVFDRPPVRGLLTALLDCKFVITNVRRAIRRGRWVHPLTQRQIAMGEMRSRNEPRRAQPVGAHAAARHPD